MNLLIFAQQTASALPPREEAYTVVAIVVSAIVLEAAALWYLSYDAKQVRVTVRTAERAGLEALTEAPRKIRATDQFAGAAPFLRRPDLAGLPDPALPGVVHVVPFNLEQAREARERWRAEEAFEFTAWGTHGRVM